MPEKCILQNRIGFSKCVAEILGTTAMRICCSGFADNLTSLELMAIIADRTQVGDIDPIAELDALDTCPDEDPRVIALFNCLKRRDVPISERDKNYLSAKEIEQLEHLDIKDLE